MQPASAASESRAKANDAIANGVCIAMSKYLVHSQAMRGFLMGLGYVLQGSLPRMFMPGMEIAGGHSSNALCFSAANSLPKSVMDWKYQSKQTVRKTHGLQVFRGIVRLFRRIGAGQNRS